MTLQEAKDMMLNYNMSWGFGLDDADQIAVWDKPIGIMAVLRRLRCLHDILDSKYYAEYLHNLRMQVDCLICRIELNSVNEDKPYMYINHYMGFNNDAVYKRVFNNPYVDRDLNEVIKNLCKSIPKDIYADAYENKRSVRRYMDMVHGGLVYQI